MAKRLPIDSSLFFKLVRVVNLTARPFVETISKAHHLSLNEWRAMVVLASHPGAAASEVAEHTGLDTMIVSRAIAALDRLGRIHKQADPDDARRTHLWLSDSGQGLFEAIGSAAAEREAQLFGGIGRAEQAAMGRTIDRLIAALKRSEAE
jgi:DNA-binding MarR family transcriptional regulator